MGIRQRDLEQEHRNGIRAILDAIPPGYDLEQIGFEPPNSGYHVVLRSTSVYGRRMSVDTYDLPAVLDFLRGLPKTWVPEERLKKPII